MKNNFEITLDQLVADELAGKASAIAAYDEMLWKIRSGYAVLLYGSIGIIVGLINKKILTLSEPTLIAISLLVIGFSLFGALIDLSFMESKLRVVNYRDELIKLSFEKSKTGKWDIDEDMLIESLKNSGERNDRVDWTGRIGKSRLFIYYGGTCLVCISAIGVLIK